MRHPTQQNRPRLPNTELGSPVPTNPRGTGHVVDELAALVEDDGLVGVLAERRWIVPDGLREIARPLAPEDRVRPQGGSTQNTPDETLFAVIIYVLVNGGVPGGLCRPVSGHRSQRPIAVS